MIVHDHFIIIKFASEINVKTKSVRLRFTRLLENNIRHVLKNSAVSSFKLKRAWDHIKISYDPLDTSLFSILLVDIPGIEFFEFVKGFPLIDVEDMAIHLYALHQDSLNHTSFRVNVKRKGLHDFTSVELERYLGGYLKQHCEGLSVSLKNPKKTIFVLVDNETYYLRLNLVMGLGGYPLPAQGTVLSLISGGLDSCLASFYMMRRGCRVHYCFFNLGGEAHELAVKKVVWTLWRRFSITHPVKFISIPFEHVIEAILEHVSDANKGVVLKRLMLRVSSLLAKKYAIPALITGESVGQVSSQTLSNLAVIDNQPDLISLLRPLIALDKSFIIKELRTLDLYEYVANIPEYCSVISQKPTVKAKLSDVLEDESFIDDAFIDSIINNTITYNVKDFSSLDGDSFDYLAIEEYSLTDLDVCVIDIRSADEIEQKPLSLFDGRGFYEIPFFKLLKRFKDLEQDKTYALYCSRDVMSRLLASRLKNLGFTNVGVIRLD